MRPRSVRFFPSLLLAGASIAPAPLLAQVAATGEGACGAAVGGTITCTAARNPYPQGVRYTRPAGTVTLRTTSDSVITGGVAVLSATNPVLQLAGQITASGNAALFILDSDATVLATGPLSSSGASAVVFDHTRVTFPASASLASAPGRQALTLTAGSISATGAQANALLINGTRLIIDVGDLTTSDTTAAVLSASGSISLTVRNSIVTSGRGVLVTGYIGSPIAADPVIIDVNRLRTSGAGGTGIQVQGSRISVKVADAATLGDNAGGVVANAIQSPTASPTPRSTATISVGSLTTAGANAPGVQASASDNLDIAVDALRTSGANSSGILAVGTRGTTVAVTNVAVTGSGSTGVFAESLGSGPVSVAIGNASAFDRSAVSIRSVAGTSPGAVTVAISGLVQAQTIAAGIAVEAAGASSITLGPGARVTGATAISGTIGGMFDIANAGAVVGTTALSTAGSGAVRLVNTGSITGGIFLNSGSDLIDNRGALTLSNSDFGAGSNQLANTGTLQLAAATAERNVTLARLGITDNAGTISLADARSGDVLRLGGAYAGSGAARLVLDVDPAARTADRLIVDGAATGRTALVINIAGGSMIGGTAIPLVTAGSGSDAQAFAFTPVQSGFSRLAVVFDGSNYALRGAPGASAYRLAALQEGQSDLWLGGAVAMTLDRSFMSGRGMSGSFQGRSFARSTVAGAAGIEANADQFSWQIDVGLVDGNAVTAGIGANYGSARQKFSDALDRATIDTANIAGYIGVRAAGLAIGAVAGVGRAWTRVANPVLGYAASIGGTAYFAAAEVRWRLGSAKAFVEPIAGIAYSRSALGRFVALGTTLGFDTVEQLRGKAGLNVGAVLGESGQTRITLNARGTIQRDFLDARRLMLTDATGSAVVSATRLPTFAEGEVGATIAGRAATLTIRGLFRTAAGYRGAGGRATLTLPF